MRSALYEGTLVHARREPRPHAFRYPVAYWLLDLDELPDLDRRFRAFAHNRPGLVSLYDRDHFDGDETPLKEAVIRFAGDPTIERVLVLTQLRVLGYVFNPVSFYWCYRRDPRAGDVSRPAQPGSDAAGGSGSGGWQLACMVAELNNTFGERLPELLRGDALTYEHDKRLHVSPFMGLDQRYRYRFSEPEEAVFARIEVHEDGRMPLHAVLAGQRRELSNAAISRFLVRYPLMPAQVIGLIHWQALKLILKRIPFHHKPPFEPGRGSVRP